VTADQTPCRAVVAGPSPDGEHQPSQNSSARRRRRRKSSRARTPVYGALDLGTNNCRLLVACPSAEGFKVIDAFSRIVRLGEGASRSGQLSEAAMVRTIDALKVCTGKMARRNVSRFRLVATEACRAAHNGEEFIDRVREATGLNLEIVDRETEARLAVAGSASLIEPGSSRALVFDIGGGSTELMHLGVEDGRHNLDEWTSLPIGVVTLAEQHGGIDVDNGVFNAMMADVRPALSDFLERTRASGMPCHMLGTSGTVTTIAGVHQGLKRYDRARVDGCWITNDDIGSVTQRLLDMSYDERAANPCIGPDRADLVLAGCAILATILEMWPCQRVRVADRGLREGILTELMLEDGNFGRGPKRRRRGRGWYSSGRRGRPNRDGNAQASDNS
jgi:exopolyphosphatase/guanosine-5'-triphosphate,3'-diphosphate pyrophosphatase